jgi:serine/threonine protein kinase
MNTSNQTIIDEQEKNIYELSTVSILSEKNHIQVTDPIIFNSWNVMGEKFELETRYRIIDYLGAGAYGHVIAVRDDITDQTFAIKKCKRIFQSRTLAKRTLREIRLLRLLQHENIIQLKTLLPPRDESGFNEIYMVLEVMETDLALIIRSKQTLTPEHVRYFTYQLLNGLNFLHLNGVIHRDLK